MTVDDVLRLRKKLEENVKVLVRRFEQETDVSVSEILLDKAKMDMKDGMTSKILEVAVNLEWPMRVL